MNRLILILCFVSAIAHGAVEERHKYSELVNDFGIPSYSLSPNEKYLLVANRTVLRNMKEVVESDPFEALGIKFNRDTPTSSNTPVYSKLSLINLESKETVKIEIGKSELYGFYWSPDSQKIALLLEIDNQIKVFTYSVVTEKVVQFSNLEVSRRLSNIPLVWLSDSKSIIVSSPVMMAPNNKSDSNQVTIYSGSRNNKGRVYRNLLDTVYRKDTFIAMMMQQLYQISEDGKEKKLGHPALIETISLSPGDRYLLITNFDKKLSGTSKFNGLARNHEVLDIKENITVKKLKDTSAFIKSRRARDGAPNGIRSVKWRPDRVATVSWIEANMNGQVKGNDDVVDTIYEFDVDSNTIDKLVETNWRLYEYYWTKFGDLIYIDWINKTKEARIFSLTKGSSKHFHKQFEYEDKYVNPGDVDLFRTPGGIQVATSFLQGTFIMFSEGFSEKGQVPHIATYTRDDVEITFGKSSDSFYSPVYLLSSGKVIASRESQIEPKKLILLNEQKEQIVFDLNPLASEIVGNQEVLHFNRADGLKMNALVTFPKVHSSNKIPALVWIYPREVKAEVGQSELATEKLNRKINPLGPKVALLENMAVIEINNFPLKSHKGEELNDNLIAELKLSSSALIQALKDTNKIDTSKLVVAGHSYGAFGVMNLLAHTDDYTAGIARSGAYNRTLTPLGFQREHRTLWEAMDTYISISPIFFADKIKEPVFLVHGEKDQNPGTDLIQSKMMFESLQIHNEDVSFIKLPFDGHNYQIKENIEEMLIKQSEFMTKVLH